MPGAGLAVIPALYIHLQLSEFKADIAHDLFSAVSMMSIEIDNSNAPDTWAQHQQQP